MRARGPLFDGRARGALRDYRKAVEEALADDLLINIQTRLRLVLRNPTGYYQRRVRKTRATGHPRVTDSRVIYGPWLEGTGSRNVTTSFKGYSTFRLMAQRTQRNAVRIAERIAPRYVARMNG